MKVSRQLLSTLIARFAQGAIEQNDQKYGRQLATICERAAASLRVEFGGRSLLLSPRPEKTSAASPHNGASRTVEACRLAYAMAEPTSEALAEQLGLPVNETIRAIVNRVRECRRTTPSSSAAEDVIITSDNHRHSFRIWPAPAFDNLSTGVRLSDIDPDEIGDIDDVFTLP